MKIKAVLVKWSDGSLEEGILLGRDLYNFDDNHNFSVYFPKRFMVLDRIQSVRDKQILSRNEVEIKANFGGFRLDTV